MDEDYSIANRVFERMKCDGVCGELGFDKSEIEKYATVLKSEENYFDPEDNLETIIDMVYGIALEQDFNYCEV